MSFENTIAVVSAAAAVISLAVQLSELRGRTGRDRLAAADEAASDERAQPAAPEDGRTEDLPDCE
ncbi:MULTISPECIES: hypothetical protein [Streptomyces]|uniref:hypothetical protein n=1 Tax=Streptomyces TaxID=1883 RepID=UPI000C6ED044|nr:hypothetical protein [Streptomyces sp. EAG2]PKR46115.1 hypothetical protein CWE27_05965 [Streptomyces sp. EAG2]